VHHHTWISFIKFGDILVPDSSDIFHVTCMLGCLEFSQDHWGSFHLYSSFSSVFHFRAFPLLSLYESFLSAVSNLLLVIPGTHISDITDFVSRRSIWFFVSCTPLRDTFSLSSSFLSSSLLLAWLVCLCFVGYFCCFASLLTFSLHTRCCVSDNYF
jgi:hypothetical protein